MRFARFLAVAALLLSAAVAQAGMIHPALQARLDKLGSDEPISVIVNLAQQAPIAQLNQDLHQRQATRQVRHAEIIRALQAVQPSQEPLKAWLDQGIRAGNVLGYTTYWISNLIVVQATKSTIEQIAARGDVDVVENNIVPALIAQVDPNEAEVSDTPANERGIGVTPGLRAIRAPECWYDLGINGTGTLIGGLDTGVNGNHVALNTRWRGYQGAHPWQECWLDVIGTGTQFPTDTHGHGSHTMGTMCGLGASTQDTIGVAWGAKWIACNAINQGVGSGFDSDIVAAFQWFADPDGNPNTVDDVPDVVQNSWGINEGFSGTPPYTDCDTRWWAAIDNCEAASVVVTWSAGNEGGGAQTLRSPADRATTLTNCFSVGAVDATSYGWPYPIASWSSRGPSGCSVPPANKIKPEVSAPGVDVYSVNAGGGYTNMSGTSMAGPHVAGVVALIRQANPSLDVDTVKNILMQTARDEGTAGEDNTYGWGCIDAFAAVQAATTGFGQIQGYVRNASWNNLPIAGATVRIVETGNTWQTDGNGYYHATIAPGTYNAEASKSGFQTQSMVVVIAQDQMTTQNFALVDNAGPAITNLTPSGSTGDTVGPYAISATIIDLSTVAWAKLFYRVNMTEWVEVAMTANGDTYSASVPGAPANSRIDYYVQAQDGVGHGSMFPPGAPMAYNTLYVTMPMYTYTAEDPGDPAWQMGVPGDNATSGVWIRDDPVGTVYNGVPVQAEDDHTPAPGVKCFVTGNGTVGGAPGDADVDGGTTTLKSPAFDLSAADEAFVTYWRWYALNGLSTDDTWAVDVSSDGGTTWLPLERVSDNRNYWQKVNVDLRSIITLTNQVVFRFIASDLGSGGLVEAAVDDFSLDIYTPDATSVPERPVQAGLAQNSPNPFHPSSTLTTISFLLSNPAQARLDVFDTTGRHVRTLVNEPLTSGIHNIRWNGLDDNGSAVGAGVYFYRLKAGAFEQSRRMTVVR